MRTKKFVLMTAMAGVVIGMMMVAPAAAAAPAGHDMSATPPVGMGNVAPPSQALDPATFSGPLVIAVPSGKEVIVQVEAGQAPQVIADVQATDRAGVAQTRGAVVAAMAGCGENVRSIAGPGVWWTSVQGCAVAGYPGYKREYHWSNASDVSLCTNGRGYNSSQVAAWYSTGCSGGYHSVPWGNVLAYTQMEGFSLSVATGAAYVWRS